MPQQQIDVGGDVSKVMVGSVKLYVAPSGTTLPNLDGSYPIVWPMGWTGVGYTESGVDLSYSPSVKEIKVDEELAPVLYVLDGEKCELSANLSQDTLDNLNRAISASTLTTTAATMTDGKFKTLKFGSGVLTEVMVGFEGYAPNDTPGATLLPAVAVGYRAMAQANVKMTFKRSEKVVIPVTFGLLADSTKSIGQRLMTIMHIVAPHS